MMPARVRGVLPGPCFALLAVAALAAGCPAEKAEQCDPACDPANCVFFEGWQCVEPSGSSSSGDAGTSGSASTTGSTPTEATEATGPTGSEGSSGGPVGCAGDTPRVRLVTSMGDMVVMLDAVNAPISAANFIHYVESDFYAGTIFHRVLDGFVIQGGGFTPDLQMKPTEPPIPLEIVPGLTHIDGAIAMARTDVLDSATSQFYICDGAQHGLDGDYAVFGVLIEGFAVRDAISAVKVDADGLPLEDVILMSASCE